MQGKVIEYSRYSRQGVILVENGKRYTFVAFDWHLLEPPKAGVLVSLDIVNRRAVSIYPAKPSNPWGDSVPLVDEHLRVSFRQFDYWFFKCLKNGFNFSGRASRREFFAFLLCYVALLCVAYFININIFWTDKDPLLLVAVIFLFPFLAVLARRLHDVNETGWIVLLGLQWLFVCFDAGDLEATHYGKPPED